MTESAPDRIRFGPFEADLHTHELWKYGTKIRLVGQPFEVLSILLRRHGELVTREELRGQLWVGDTYVDFDHGLNAAVNKLRDALSDSAESPRYVETLPRRGYRFIGQVSGSNGARAKAGNANAAEGVSTTQAATAREPFGAPLPTGRIQTAAGPSQRSWRAIAPAVALIVVLAVGAAFVLYRFSSKAGVHNGPAAVERIHPLTSLGDPTSEPAFSPDGNYVAFHREATTADASGIYVKHVGSDQLTQLTHNPDDCCAAWSPDGRSLAFSRGGRRDFEYQIFVLPLSHGAENAIVPEAPQRIDTGSLVPRHGEIAWSPDGKAIVISSGVGLSLVSLTGTKVRRLTTPPPAAEDWEPSFSPDGNQVLFVRTQTTGFLEEIMSVAAEGGEVARIAAEQHSRILGPPQWSPDGQSVIFGSDRASHPALWRVSATSNDPPVEINDTGWYPAVSRRGFRLAYQRVTHSLSVWELGLPQAGKEQHIVIPATSETDQGPGPQISPDGKKLAYMSDRSGTMEIWVSDRDGSNATQVTAIGFAGTPRWSPDGTSIAFDAATREGPNIFSVRIDGGAARQLVLDTHENVCPSWSHDGKWVYFASHRMGQYQVWKVPAEGGTPVQITHYGGHAPLESLDGRYVYYAKTEYANPEIWQVPVGGGTEKLVSPLIRPASWAAWSVTEKGIVFAASLGNGEPGIHLFDFAGRHMVNLASIKTVPFWLGASRDGKSVVFDQPGWQQAQIMLVENFR